MKKLKDAWVVKRCIKIPDLIQIHHATELTQLLSKTEGIADFYFKIQNNSLNLDSSLVKAALSLSNNPFYHKMQEMQKG